MRRILVLAIAWFLVASGAAAAPLGPDGTAGQSLPGKFTWFDLATEDPAGARTFYGAVFGWKFTPVKDAPASYMLIENETGKVGGLFKHARPKDAKAGARWLSIISVRDPAAVAKLVRENGGAVLLEPKAVAGRGTHAVFRDPEGAVFGVLAAEGGDPPDTPVEDGDVFWLDLFARASRPGSGLLRRDRRIRSGHRRGRGKRRARCSRARESRAPASRIFPPMRTSPAGCHISW